MLCLDKGVFRSEGSSGILSNASEGRIFMCYSSKLLHIGIMLALVIGWGSSASAEEWTLESSLREVERLSSEGSFPGALRELERARGYLLDQKNERVKKFFPNTISEAAGEKIEVSVALGLTNMTRLYKGKNIEFKLSLLGGGKSISSNEDSGLGRMAAMIQKEDGGVALEIGGRSALLDESGARPELSIFLKSGGIFKLEGRNNITSAQLKGFAAKIDIKGLDSYLEGAP